MKNKESAARGAVKYACLIAVQRLIGAAAFYIAAGTAADMRANANLALYIFTSAVAVAIMLKGHGKTLAERGKRRDNTKGWDKLLLPALALLAYFGIYAAAGLGVRLGLAKLPLWCFWAGTALYPVSAVFTVWPVMENTHFEATARIQSDRAHAVVSTGPYRIVRHPGYFGLVLWSAASALMFGTWPAASVAAAVIAILFARTYMEDTMLKNELDGYRDYAKRVKRRLIPLIW